MAKRNTLTSRMKAAASGVGIVRLVTAALLAVLGGWFAFSVAASGINRTRNPEVALRFQPNESNALAEQADLLFFAKPEAPAAKVELMAKAALRQQAVNPKALRLLGYYADAKKRPGQAQKAIDASLKLSRREAGTHLWLIEAYARQGRMQDILKHYDMLLRTKPSAQALLFPRLQNAIGEPEIRSAMKPYVRSKKAWVSVFLGQVVGGSKDLGPLVSLIVDAKGFPPVPASRGQEQSLLRRLATDKRFDDVHRIFLLVPGAKASRLTDASFDVTDRDGRYGPVGWHIADDPDVGGGFVASAGSTKPSLQVFANASTNGIAASKLLYLRAGSYRFRAELSSIDRGGDGALRWQLRCANGPENRPFWILEMDRKTANTEVNVPAGCAVQYLDVMLSGGSAQTGTEAVIKTVSIDTRVR